MRIAQLRTKLGMGRNRSKGRQKMTFADTAKTCERERLATACFDQGDAVDPSRHQIGGNIGKVVTSKSLRQIFGKILQIYIGPNLNNVFDFFFDAFHEGWINRRFGKSAESVSLT